MKLKDIFTIEKLDYRTATDIIVEKHYLHRQAPCSHSFGLIRDGRIVGVVMYGVSCSSTLLKGVCGPDEAKNVYELTRLWIEDGQPKNSASFLVGNTIKLLDREIIVSFAEIRAGHVGYVYQALNFMYCGLSSKFRDPKVKGLEHQHHATYANSMTMQEIRDRYGAENVYYVDRPRKHRYVYFNVKTKRRKKELLDKLRYKVMDYPKANKGEA